MASALAMVALVAADRRTENASSFSLDVSPITCTVTAFDEAAGRLGWSWRGPGARGHHLWSLSPSSGGTRVITQETQRGPLPRLTAPLLRRVMHAGHDAWLRGIEREVSRG